MMFDENWFAYPIGTNIRIWNIDRSCPPIDLKGHKRVVNCVALYINFIVSGSDDETVRVWGLANATPVNKFFGHSGAVLAVAICADIVAIESYDKTVRLWSIKKKLR
jgi:WD40 repeat protein